MSRVVASLTTMPTRYDVLALTIDSLLKQTRPPDVIYLTLPEYSRRRNVKYPPLPPHLAQHVTVVTPPQDYGPICKIYGGLVMEHDPETIIITFDDDVIYPPTLIEAFLIKAEYNTTDVICGTGALIGKGLMLMSIYSSIDSHGPYNGMTGPYVDDMGRKIDLIFGVTGVMYRRKHFPRNIKYMLKYTKDESLRANDDVVISGYLAKRGVTRMMYPDIPRITLQDGADALSAEPHMIMRLNSALEIAHNHGLFTSYEHVSLDETIAGRAIIVLALLLLLVILIWYFAVYVL